MRLEMYDEIAEIYHSEKKDIFFVQHMIENTFFVKKVIYSHVDLQLYEQLAKRPHSNLANVIGCCHHHHKSIIIEEFINGCTLEYKLSQRKLAPEESIMIMDQLFQVVTHIHELPIPIIHRDIKPDNILIDKEHVYLIDFEIAKRYMSDYDSISNGSEGYAAPEQYQGISNQQSDIYALGSLLYYLDMHTRWPTLMKSPFDHIIKKSMAQGVWDRYINVSIMASEFKKAYNFYKSMLLAYQNE